MRFKEKVVLVTGGSRGIGKSIVEAFAAEGAVVLFTYLKNDSCAKALADSINKQNQKAHAYKIDVRDYDRIGKWREEVLDKFGRVDILVNNAGIIIDKALMMMTQKDWQEVIDTNLNGMFKKCDGVRP